MAAQITPADVADKFREAIALWQRNLKQASDALYTARQLGCPQETIDSFEAKVLEANRRVNRLRRERAAFLAHYAVEPKEQEEQQP